MDEEIEIFSINARGLASNKSKLIEICNIVKKNKKHETFYVLIQETKLEKMKPELLKIIQYNNLSFQIVPSENKSGGLMILYDKNTEIELLDKNQCSLTIRDKKSDSIIINTYVNPKQYNFQPLKDTIETLELTCDQTIYMGGDFNAIDPSDINEENKTFNMTVKSNDIRLLRSKKLIHLNSSLLLIDLAQLLQNRQPTHFETRSGKQSRIDYIFSNNENLTIEKNRIETLPFAFSDHKCLHLFRNSNYQYSQKLWKLDNIVFNYPEKVKEILETSKVASEKFGNIVSCHDIFKAKLRDQLKYLSATSRKMLVKQKEKIQMDIEKLEENCSKGNCSDQQIKQNLEHLTCLKNNLQLIKNEESENSFQQIKNFFREANDGNTKNIKCLAKASSLAKDIKKIEKQDGSFTEDPDEILNEFKSFYEKLSQPKWKPTETSSKSQDKFIEKFFKQKRKSIENIEKLFKETLEDPDNEITVYEVEKAISKLNSNSAPGSDGLTSQLYQNHKNFFAPYLSNLFNKINENGEVPDSFKHAIIKVIPKKNNSLKVSEFRPISLINTDKKILSHVLAERLKPILSILIGNHQNAHLPNRNIHIAVQKIQHYAHETTRSQSLIAIDFTKAFDCVERSFLQKLIEKSPIDKFTQEMILLTYKDTYAFIGMKNGISTKFKIDRGVRQGCPLSALIFNLCLEPLLQRIQKSKYIKSKQQTKCIAYADDITISLYNKSLRKLLIILDHFHEIAGLEVNLAKTEILSKADKIFVSEKLTRVTTTKILGVYISLNKTLKKETKNAITNAFNSAEKFILKNSSFRARARNIETFIYSKLIHHLRHENLYKKFLRKIQSKIIDVFWLYKKHNVKKEILELPIEEGGVNLKNFSKYYLTAKIMNLKFLAVNPKERKYIQELKKSKFFSELKKHFEKEHIEILELKPEEFTIQHHFTTLNITKETTSKEIYTFLNNSSINVPPSLKTEVTATKQNIASEILNSVTKNIWKNKKLTSFDKNYLYCFLMNSYLDKQDKWLKNLVLQPLCFACEAEFETWDHLMFSCKKLKTLTMKLNVFSWKEIWLDRSCLSQKLLVAIMLSSWTESIGDYLKYFLERMKVILIPVANLSDN